MLKQCSKHNYLIIMPRVARQGMFPLGIPYISAVMKQNNLNLYTLNLSFVDRIADEIIRIIVDHQIDVVLSGGLSAQFDVVKPVFDIAKSVDNNIVTICGGGIISSNPEIAMKALETVDFGVIGEGEIAIIELCSYLEGTIEFSEIKGIIRKEGDSYHQSELRREIADIDSLPSPDYEGFDYNQVLEHSDLWLNGIKYSRVAAIATGRSCPYSCTFCFHTSGKKYRQRSLDSVFSEIEYLCNRFNIGALYIVDELFSLSLERIEEFCRRIKQLRLPWIVSLRLDTVNEPLLRMLNDAYCVLIAPGIESADNSILKSMKKQITIKEIERGLKLILKSGINITGNFIFGDIMEDRGTAQNTINWWKQNRKYGINMSMISVYPGTYLYEYAVKNKLVIDEVAFLKNGCPMINVSRMSDEEFQELRLEIARLPFTSGAELTNATVRRINYSDGHCDITGNCPHCSHENSYDDVQVFGRGELLCRSCHGCIAMVMPQQIVSLIDANLSRMLKHNEALAVWGIGYFLKNFLEQSESVKNPQVHLIDFMENKQGMVVFGKKINSSDIVINERITAIVVTATMHFEVIRSEIREKYPDVEVCSILELLSFQDEDNSLMPA